MAANKTRTVYTGGVPYVRDRDHSPANSFWQKARAEVLAGEFDPAGYARHFSHFTSYGSADFTTTTVTSGSPTQALSTTAKGGVLLITNTNGATDSTEQQHLSNWVLASGKPLWYEVKLQVSEATSTKVWVGLAPTDTTLITGVADGLYFFKDSGAATVDFVTRASSTSTTASAIVSVTAATYLRFGIYWDGVSTVTPYVDGVAYAASATNVPASTVMLRPSWGIRNASGSAYTMSLDYFGILMCL